MGTSNDRIFHLHGFSTEKSRSEASSAHASTAEQRLKVFMQDVTGRALVMMESATQGQQGIAMDLVQEAFIALHKSYADRSTEEWYPYFILF